jgi:hypothetical protein
MRLLCQMKVKHVEYVGSRRSPGIMAKASCGRKGGKDTVLGGAIHGGVRFTESLRSSVWLSFDEKR